MTSHCTRARRLLASGRAAVAQALGGAASVVQRPHIISSVCAMQTWASCGSAARTTTELTPAMYASTVMTTVHGRRSCDHERDATLEKTTVSPERTRESRARIL